MTRSSEIDNQAIDDMLQLHTAIIVDPGVVNKPALLSMIEEGIRYINHPRQNTYDEAANLSGHLYTAFLSKQQRPNENTKQALKTLFDFSYSGSLWHKWQVNPIAFTNFGI